MPCCPLLLRPLLLQQTRTPALQKQSRMQTTAHTFQTGSSDGLVILPHAALAPRGGQFRPEGRRTLPQRRITWFQSSLVSWQIFSSVLVVLCPSAVHVFNLIGSFTGNVKTRVGAADITLSSHTGRHLPQSPAAHLHFPESLISPPAEKCNQSTPRQQCAEGDLTCVSLPFSV